MTALYQWFHLCIVSKPKETMNQQSDRNKLSTFAHLSRHKARKNLRSLGLTTSYADRETGPREARAWGAGFLGTEPVFNLPTQRSFYRTMAPLRSHLGCAGPSTGSLHTETKTTELSHLRHGQPWLCQELGFKMYYKPSIYGTGMALEDRFSSELVFGGEFTNVTGLGGLCNTGCYKS